MMSFKTQSELDEYVASLCVEMREAAANLDFEQASKLRDRIRELRKHELGVDQAP